MNPFLHAISSGNSLNIENLTLRITGGQQTVLNSIYWFDIYKASDFPTIICDKTYFCLFSTDHASSGAGKINWGKCNNPNLSDFQEVATMFTGNQNETPFAINIPQAECGDTETFHLFFHTDAAETGNNNFQQTRLYTSTGGSQLHQLTWTDKGRPLGIVGDENHTGYYRGYKRGVNDYIATHIGKGGLPQPWKTSVSTNGRTYTRHQTIDVITGVEAGYFAQLSDGVFFNKFGQQWWIGQLHPETGSAIFDADKKIALCKSTNFNNIQQVSLLNEGAENLRHTVNILGDTAHIFITNPTNKLYHGTLNLGALITFM